MKNLFSPAAALRVCVDSGTGGELSGMAYSQRLTEPLVFSNLIRLILMLDQLMDEQNFPQAYQRARTFQEKAPRPVSSAAAPGEGLAADIVQSATGAAGAFTLFITSRREASWQGTIDWEDGSAPVSFASALQLIRLLGKRYP
ncbi:MAG: hypothetical protein H6Q60_1102 [Oscillospiraceae bacterium]|nr:hypothetical protein [Oscillospiraceae bacterium]